MSAKPTKDPSWCLTGTNVADPTSGERADGWGHGVVPDSLTENGWRKIIASYCQYILDADLDVEGMTYGTTAVALGTGTTNNCDPFGGSFAGKAIVQLTGGGGGATITGIVSSGAAEGRSFWLVNETGNEVTIAIEGAGSSAANRIDCADATSSQSVVMPSKGAVMLTYTDPPTGRWAIRASNFVLDFETRTRTIVLPPAKAREIGGSSHTLTQNFYTLGSTTDDIVFPLDLVEGDMITAWTLRMDKGGTSATYVVDLRKVNMTDGTVSTVGTAATNSAISPGFIVLSDGGLTEVVQHACVYFLRLVGAPAFDADDLLYGASVSVSRTGL